MTAYYLSNIPTEDAPDAWQIIPLINSAKPNKKTYTYIKLKKLSGLADNICYWSTSNDGVFWGIASNVFLVTP